jgi:hypothetical protein
MISINVSAKGKNYDCLDYKIFRSVDLSINPGKEPAIIYSKIVCKSKNFTIVKVRGRFFRNKYLKILGKVDKNVGDFFNFPFVNKMLIKEN